MILPKEECPDCEGKGTLPESDCCGANIDSDMLICHECKEHSDMRECDTCNGTGEVPQIEIPL